MEMMEIMSMKMTIMMLRPFELKRTLGLILQYLDFIASANPIIRLVDTILIIEQRTCVRFNVGTLSDFIKNPFVFLMFRVCG